MPEERTPIDDELADRLDRVCAAHGFETHEEAMRWLISRRLARGARQISMRGRALHLIRNRDER